MITATPVKEQDWTLDATGNWSGFIDKVNGTTDLNQTRTANKAQQEPYYFRTLRNSNTGLRKTFTVTIALKRANHAKSYCEAWTWYFR